METKTAITKTCLYSFDPLQHHCYIVKLGFTGLYTIFLISAHKKKKKKMWVRVRTASQYTSTLCRCIQNLKTPALIGAEKSVRNNVIGEKEKWTNKMNDKHEDADSLLHDTRSHSQCLYKISKS